MLVSHDIIDVKFEIGFRVRSWIEDWKLDEELELNRELYL